MDLPVSDDLRSICREIVAEGETNDEWSEIEADDSAQRVLRNRNHGPDFLRERHT
jgi:hypothetical protein